MTSISQSDKPVQTETGAELSVATLNKSVQTGEEEEESHTLPRDLDTCVALYKQKVKYRCTSVNLLLSRKVLEFP